MKEIQIQIPKSVFLDQDTSNWGTILDTLNFPVILKPRVSSIVSHSHDLFIVRDKECALEVIENNAYLKEDSIIV